MDLNQDIERATTQAPTAGTAEFDRFLEQAANVLGEWGLRLPALIALEVGRPLAFFGGQLIWVAQPALSLILPAQVVRQAARLLEEPAAIDALIARLEANED